MKMSDFSFVVITDSHVDVRGEREDGCWWNRMLVSLSPEILSGAVGEINERHPDLVVHCGDLTHRSDEESLREAARIVGGLEMPFHFVPGNHDTYDPGARRLAADLFGVGDGPFYRVERFAGWRLLFLDTAYWRCKDGSVREEFLPDEYVDIAAPEAEMAWVQSEFERDSETPTLCFTHTVMAVRESYPVSRMPRGKAVESFPARLDHQVTCAELTEIIKGQPCVKAAFYGHGHWHECLVQDDVLFCQTGALVSYPNEMRLVRVLAHRIETEVFGLPGSNYPALSYVEEYGNRWVAGRDIDRRITHIL